MNHENSIAIETPTWKKIKKLSITYTGHIDLISFHNGSLRIDDYKPNKTELLKSIPQICLYGLMVKYILEDIAKEEIKLKCRIFCKDYAIEFSPEILGSYVLNFIKYMNSIRRVNLVDIEGNDIQKVIEDFFL